jgi:hypothetical protein
MWHESEVEETMNTDDEVLNPVFEQHLRQLKNWTVADGFRRRFTELSTIIDSDSSLYTDSTENIASME